MKRVDLIRYLLKHGCSLVREGAKHSVFFNATTGHTSTVPRHGEINFFLAKKICRDLGIDDIVKRGTV
ncbi:addiction module toxin, HicA family [Candidatus Campbellbacteria bacterium CG10_big_fil_rev_8_21_14_0_10_35_52]|uniref:Addiction module toxin, HicA family n=1 Tax=Candidatus Campbellbacteria bacterium CG10_big_fil_rev_8_21_14_0_10_35_52 TaxID=1974527 RepID=A0A2M6WV93_9BACT|nr:MAG: addiction module toxin, HicA family [Candidatus Campbellbacteria bacterium CG10_big_fil_rev_8_21_14_0_10_35_52]